MLIAGGSPACDLADPDALQRACTGADAVFGLSVPFGEGGKDEEVAQGHLLVDTVARLDAHLVYSSVRGGDRLEATNVDHADSKQLIEAYLREQPVRATVLGPVYFMENALNLGFSRLGDGMLANPLTPGKPLDQVSVLDIAGLAVHAVENPDEFESFENNTDFLDIETLHAKYPAVRWHSYAEWAKTVDWDRALA
ncbi:NmrA family NAD(P)-binding protein [Nonomuraea angiospora]|uniref:NmrA family NAD(P)-binding protein n=1 Tax=Nonomuraea angiospora TaxID=46172 RepID=UPI0033D0E0EE